MRFLPPLCAALLVLGACDGVAGRDEYDRGVKAADTDRLEEAVEFFLQATKKNPEFTEAWYGLGSCRFRLAVRAAKEGRRKDAVELFWTSVDDKLTSMELATGKKFFVWDDAEAKKAMLKTYAEIRAAEMLDEEEEDLLMEVLSTEQEK
ncbi:MAG: hypothetical protein ACYTAF_05325 [Planctomycetota bacterium]|jgi:tetratricopeptide (TPR) repeat protein